MKKYLTIASSFIIMLCLGGIYAWSIIGYELIEKFEFSTAQTQIVFGAVIAIFPLTMVFTGKLSKRINSRNLSYISALLFFSGYLLAGLSRGNFYLILLGAGILAGIGTGFGYLVSISVPVKWFPERKGLITGIAAAGFGLGAVVLSFIAESILQSGKSIFFLFIFIGTLYGVIIFLFSNLIFQPVVKVSNESVEKSGFLSTRIFRRLFAGIFLGTFSGLLMIGSLKIIGEQSHIAEHSLVLGVSIFAASNFLGRLFWGHISDSTGADLSILIALGMQAAAIFLFGFLTLNSLLYLSITALIGFGFGGNFVLFARETAQIFGIDNLKYVYPYVFLGYAIAGIAGPLSGGLLFDYTGSFTAAIYLASFISLCGALLFLFPAANAQQRQPGYPGSPKSADSAE